MSSMFGDVLGSVISSVLSNQQGSQSGLGGMLGGALGSIMNGGRQNSEGGLGGLGSMLGGHNQQNQSMSQDILGGMFGSMGGLAGSGGNAGLLAALLPMAFQLIQSQGGLSGLAAKFQNAGMGDQLNSWVGTGANQAIHGEDVAQVMGSATIAQLAQQLGLPQEEVSSGLAEVLPEIVNQMTPQGNVPDDHHQTLDQSLAALTRMLA